MLKNKKYRGHVASMSQPAAQAIKPGMAVEDFTKVKKKDTEVRAKPKAEEVKAQPEIKLPGGM